VYHDILSTSAAVTAIYKPPLPVRRV